MAISSAEEESLEALRKWWQDTGKSLAIGLAVAAAAFFGWQQWQNAQTRTSAEASAVYEQLTALVVRQPGQVLTDSERAQAEELFQRIRAEHGSSVYALYAALFAARLAVETNDLDTAEQELRWLLANIRTGFFNKTEEALVLTAQLRLGRVLFAQGEGQQGLDLIAGIEPGSFQADFAELKGDLHLLLNQSAEAQSAWQEALELDPSSVPLQMKLNNLTIGI